MRINGIREVRHILIVGCGRLGASIANTLSNQNKNVIMVDKDKNAFRKLGPSFSGVFMDGNGIEIEVLKDAQIEKAQVVIAVTDDDNINILIAQMAKHMFKVNEVIVRLYDPEKECLYKDDSIHTIFPALLSASEVDRILDL